MQITQTLKHPNNLVDQKLGLLILTACYFLFWLALRIDSVFANVLYADDFLFFVDHSSTITKFDICRFPAQDYRWLSSGILCFLATYLPDFSLSAPVKLLGGLLLSGFACSLYCCFNKWGISRVVSIVTPLILLSHPIVNEITLWNTTTLTSFWFLFAATAYLILSYSANTYYRIFGVAQLLALALAYEYSLIVFLLLIVSEPFISFLHTRKVDFRKFVTLTLIFMGVAVFYILQIKLSSVMFPDELISGRGLARVQDLGSLISQKIHGVFNLLVNVYMTPLSYFVPLERSWGLWKWLPVSVMVSTFAMVYIKKRSLLISMVYSVFTIAIVSLPTASLFASSQSPESWRVAIPLLIGFTCGLLPIFSTLTSIGKEITVYVIIFLLVATQSIVTASEAELRVVENDLEKSLLVDIRDYWTTNEISKDQFRVGMIKKTNFTVDPNVHPAQNLSVAYRRRELLLALKMDFAWRGRLLFEDFKLVELYEDDSAFMQRFRLPCTEAFCKPELELVFREKCYAQPDIVQSQTGMRVVHDFENRISAICI